VFTVRSAFTTVMSAVQFEVFDVITGRVVLVTRDAGKGLSVAASLNSGADVVAIF
jgi:hypothetical protein